MGGGHGILSWETDLPGLKWHFDFSGKSHSSTITNHDTTYVSSATNLALASTGDSGAYQNAAGGGATSTSPNVTSDNIKAGWSEVDFIGDEQHLDITDADGTDLSAFTMYIVFRVINEDANILNILSSNAALTDYIYYNANVNKFTYKIDNGTQVLFSNALTLADNNSYVACVKFSSGTAIAITATRAGLGQGATVTSTSHVAGDYQMKSIGSIVGSGSYTADWYVGEVLIFENSHGSQKMKNVITQLKQRWDIPY
jgi:hypothetical protein